MVRKLILAAELFPVMADINDDGLMDLLLGSGEGYLYYCENQGSQANPLFASPVVLVDVMGMPMTVESNCFTLCSGLG